MSTAPPMISRCRANSPAAARLARTDAIAELVALPDSQPPARATLLVLPIAALYSSRIEVLDMRARLRWTVGLTITALAACTDGGAAKQGQASLSQARANPEAQAPSAVTR